MTFDEILAKLPEDQRTVITAKVTELETAVTNASGVSSKDKAEKNRLLKKYKPIEDLLTEHEINLEADDYLESLKSRLAVKKAADGTGSDEYKALKKQVDALIKERDEHKAKAEKVGRARILETVKGKLNGKVYNHDAEAFMLVNSGKVSYGEDGESLVWKNDSGDVELESGIGEYLKTRKDILINQQHGGGGSAPNKGGNGKQMSQDEWLKMEPKARAQFFKDGGTLT